MPQRPLALRLVIPFAILIVLVVGVCGSVVWWAGRRNVELQQIHDLDRLVGLVRGIIGGETLVVSAEQWTRLKDLAAVLDTRITLIDGAGVVQLDTHYNPAVMENHNSRPEVIEARARGGGTSVRRSNTISENAVYVAQLLDHNKHDGIVVRLSFPEYTWAKLGVPAWMIVLAATVLSAMVMAGLAWILQRRWIGPVRELAGASEKITAGAWETRVDPAGADDVRALGGVFNVMAAHAQKQMADLNHQRADLQGLVDSLPDPILLSDALGRIMVINTPAARLLQLTPAQAMGKKVGVVMNEESILKVIDQVPESGPVTREIRLARNGQRVTYQAVAARAKSGGVLLVLRNVSALAATLQMKTDFVANASHELRTPLAAIKMAFETLQEVYREDPSQTAKCVTIIDGHLKRLEEMLTDLLDLSRVESPDLRAQVSPVRAEELFAVIRSTMGQTAREKGVELEFTADPSPDEMEFNSDRRLLDLVLKNLVENAIKFTPAGGKISVRLGRRDKSVTMDVIDTGIGIPLEHQERVFERFYQVNASRTGAAGRGTGLGLAIVKHAVHGLRGTVELSSESGKGTTVTCVFPALAAVEENAADPAAN